MRLRLFRPSLRYLLPVFFFLMAAIPAGAIGVLLTGRAWDRELQTVHEQHLQLARNLAMALARYAQDVEAVFKVTAMTAAGDPQATSVRDLANLLDRLHFKHVCIVNDSGRVESLVSPDFDLKLERVPERILELLRTGADADHRPEFSDIFLDQGGEPTVFIWQRLRDARYALGALKTDYFTELQSAISFGKKGHAAIVDRRGHIIAHPNPEWRSTLKDISDVDPVRRMMAGETGVSRFYSPFVQAEMIAGFTTTPNSGWGVMIPQPLSELEAHVEQVKRAVWFVIGLALLGAAVLGCLVSRWLVAPLERIGSVAESFANGSYNARVIGLNALQTREAAKLAIQFDTMADEINRSWQAQRESEQRFRSFAQIAADCFWETDLQQVFTYISMPSKNGLQWDSEEIVGRHRRETVLGDPDGKVVALIQKHMKREEPFSNVEYLAVGSGGQPVYISLSGEPVRDASGAVKGYRGVARDISFRKQAEEALREARDELERRVRARTAALSKSNALLKEEINERKRVEKELRIYQGRLQSLASDLILTEERERRRIAEELHDHIGPALAFSKIKLGTLGKREGSEDLADELNEILELLEQTIRDTRSLTFEISPPVLYELGLAPAIEWLAENIQKKHGIAVEFVGDGLPESLSDDIRVFLFQAVRELLNNAVKHANARKAKVSTGRDTDCIRVVVEDDGTGFEISLLDKAEGFGLFNIRQRLALLDGQIDIESEPGRGTRVILSVPFARVE